MGRAGSSDTAARSHTYSCKLVPARWPVFSRSASACSAGPAHVSRFAGKVKRAGAPAALDATAERPCPRPGTKHRTIDKRPISAWACTFVKGLADPPDGLVTSGNRGPPKGTTSTTSRRGFPGYLRRCNCRYGPVGGPVTSIDIRRTGYKEDVVLPVSHFLGTGLSVPRIGIASYTRLAATHRAAERPSSSSARGGVSPRADDRETCGAPGRSPDPPGGRCKTTRSRLESERTEAASARRDS